MAGTVENQNESLHKTGANVFEIITLYLRWHESASGQIVQTAYGINASKVRELVAMPENPVEVPDSPPSVKGVFLLRDKTIPLIDLCEWFGYEADAAPETVEGTVVIVTEINTKEYAFICHGVDKVHRVSWEDIKPPPELIVNQSSITGVCLMDGAIIQMIDFEKIIASIDPASAARIATSVPAEKLGKKVIVVEDSKTAQNQMLAVLESAGYDVVTHSDGKSCWDWLEAERERGMVAEQVDAVVSDIEMPRMDGLHLCKLIKEQPAYQAIPVMLFSSLINDAVRRKCESAGADDQISKSELDQLVDRLQACIDRKK